MKSMHGKIFYFVAGIFFPLTAARAGIISDAPGLATLLLAILKFFLSVAGILAVLALVFSGIMYIASVGNTQMAQKAKQAALYSVAGIIFILVSLVIVNQVVDIFGY